MFLELIATIIAGLAAAGVVIVLRRLVGPWLPRWLAPVAAGLVMLGVTIANEYSWYDRAQRSLPAGMEVALTGSSPAPWRPWTYVVPFVDRFVAVDHASLRTHEGQPGQKMVNLIFFGRWAPVHRVPVLMDCVNGRRADLVDGMEFAQDGTLEDARWRKIDPEGPLAKSICEAT